jgi:predicted enzyme related to lactoylglutathione lyase
MTVELDLMSSVDGPTVAYQNAWLYQQAQGQGIQGRQHGAARGAWAFSWPPVRPRRAAVNISAASSPTAVALPTGAVNTLDRRSSCRTPQPRVCSQVLLSGPGASGSRPMPNGQRQEPGGWNRIVLRVSDLRGCIGVLRSAGLRFRNEMESGPGGRQIQIEDPDGNPIELFEPSR